MPPEWTCPYCGKQVVAVEDSLHQTYGTLKAWKWECPSQDGFLGSHFVRKERQDVVDLPAEHW